MPAFVHEMRVRYHETDPQRHVYNARYLEYLDGDSVAVATISYVNFDSETRTSRPIPNLLREKLSGLPLGARDL